MPHRADRRRTWIARLTAMTVGVAALLAVGCTKPDPAPGSTTASGNVPTATPFARVPDPVIVATARPNGTGTPGTGEASKYTVQSGDVLSALAERFGVTAAAIRQANNMTSDELRAGDQITIPGRPAANGTATPTATGGPPRPTPPPVTTSNYVVEPGDSGFGLALRFQITLAELEAANGVAPGGLDDLQIGQTIKIPRPR